ncbi:MAG: hypothetical protein RLZZ142_1835 [Verrucomicrobiota bacterium]|jgi:hypothetical protein
MRPTLSTHRLKTAALAFLAASGSVLPSLATDYTVADLLQTLRQRGTISEEEYQRMSKTNSKTLPRTVDTVKDSWFEKMGIRGYVQTRYTHVLEGDEAQRKSFSNPADPSVQRRDQLILRRGRMIFSGDMHEHLYLYAQIDYQAGVGSSYSETAQSGLQTRDLYGDINLDQNKEHRIRLGISKVPYGFVNLQSSQNRLSLERPEALNSAVEGERDLGVYYMWANKVARARFKELVATGLKGSGDYGVATIGLYNGQGLNRYDSNRNPHVLARLAYPFKLESGQFFELGISGYHGQFVPGGDANANTTTSGQKTKPARSYDDTRAAANFVWYPQPFGLEAEWTVGRGPETSVWYGANGVGVNSSQGITTQNLQGGYVNASYKVDTSSGVVIPFTRWSYFDGARKFVAGAPTQKVNEVDFGVEYQPWPAFEVALIYTRAIERSSTNATTGSSAAPNYLTKGNDRISIQGQFNY